MTVRPRPGPRWTKLLLLAALVGALLGLGGALLKPVLLRRGLRNVDLTLQRVDLRLKTNRRVRSLISRATRDVRRLARAAGAPDLPGLPLDLLTGPGRGSARPATRGDAGPPAPRTRSLEPGRTAAGKSVGVDLLLHVEIHNRNPSVLVFQEAEYRVSVSGHGIGTGRFAAGPPRLRLPAGGRRVVILPLELSPLGIPGVVRDVLIKGRPLIYRAKGRLTVHRGEVRLEGAFDIQRKASLKLPSLGRISVQ